MNKKSLQFNQLSMEHLVSGSIFKKYTQLGAENGLLGFPIGRRIVYNKKKQSECQPFQGGHIFYQDDIGSFYLAGKIYRHWADNLGAFGKYGHPTSDPYIINATAPDDDAIIAQNFEHGIIRADQAEIKNKASLIGEINRRGISIRNQGPRPTCSVQVMTLLLEYFYSGFLGKKYNHLSCEYLNHFANVVSGNDYDGAYFHDIEHGYNEYGIILNSLWPYRAKEKYSFQDSKNKVTEQMINSGKKLLDPSIKPEGHFVKNLDGTIGLNENQMETIISFLDKGIPIGVGRAHSMAIVGYEKDEDFPGGGLFTFRNSYGKNDAFTGYQTESFESVKNTSNDVYVYAMLTRNGRELS